MKIQDKDYLQIFLELMQPDNFHYNLGIINTLIEIDTLLYPKHNVRYDLWNKMINYIRRYE